MKYKHDKYEENDEQREDETGEEHLVDERQ